MEPFVAYHGVQRNRMDVEDASSRFDMVSGHRAKAFPPAMPVDGLEWLPSLLKSQSGFSLGSAYGTA